MVMHLVCAWMLTARKSCVIFTHNVKGILQKWIFLDKAIAGHEFRHHFFLALSRLHTACYTGVLGGLQWKKKSHTVWYSVVGVITCSVLVSKPPIQGAQRY